MSDDFVEYITVDNYHENQSIKLNCFKNCVISVELFLNKIWEPHMHRVFEKYITKNSIVIEGGAYIGVHTLKLAYLSRYVYAFEPMPQSNTTLLNNIKLNNIENVFVYRKGLSDKPGTTTYEWSEVDNPGCSGLANNPLGKPNSRNLFENSESKIEVNLINIDSLNLVQVDFIKLDIEGYEILAIKGAIETIKRCKPIIAMEVWSSGDNTFDIEYTKIYFKELLEMGYTVEHIEGPDFLFLPIQNQSILSRIIS
jgi:FkbM family methyltransferase